MSATVEIRGASHDLLHGIVREGFPPLRAALAGVDRSLPRYVEREFEGYLGCGDPAGGFAWLVCDGCERHRLVPFSCKGRGFCPSCGGRRMASMAAGWVDGVFPRVAVRQWVLTVPWKHRWTLARRPGLARGVLRIALRVVTRWMRERTGAEAGQGGSVTVVQRFGSALNLNLHFHILALDGVYQRDAATQALRFHRSPPPTTEEVGELVSEVAGRAERWLKRRGVTSDIEVDEDDAQQVLMAASVQGRQALGPRAGAPVRTVQVFGGRAFKLPPRCASSGGYNLHAGVVVKARDRAGLERVCRYVARPPLAKERLERLPDGRVEVGMKRVWSDGTRALVLTPAEFCEKLAALVPPPRSNQVLYHGILAPNAAWRREVVPKPPRPKREHRRLSRGTGIGNPRWMAWSELLWRVFAVDGWRCEGCARVMRLKAVVEGPPASTGILAWLRRGRDPPGGGEAET